MCNNTDALVEAETSEWRKLGKEIIISMADATAVRNRNLRQILADLQESRKRLEEAIQMGTHADDEFYAGQALSVGLVGFTSRKNAATRAIIEKHTGVPFRVSM